MTTLMRALLAALGCVLILRPGFAQQTSSAPAPAGSAQFSLISGREPVTSLAGLWRFHPGDDPAWAAPGLADESWPLLRSDKPWNEQGYGDLAGYAWYRFTVEEPAGGAPYSLLLPEIRTAYQVFVDGRLVKTVGKPGSAYRTWTVWPLRIDLPPSTPAASHVAHIALRVWRNNESVRLGGTGGPVAGELSLVAATPIIQRELKLLLSQERSDGLLPSFPLLMVHLCAALISMALWARNRKEREYLWFAAFNLLLVFPFLVDPFLNGKVVDRAAYVDFNNFLYFSGIAALVVFYRRYTRTNVTVSYRIAIAALLLLVPLQQIADRAGLYFYRDLAGIPFILALVIWSLLELVHSRKFPGSGQGLISGAVLLWAAQVEYAYTAAMLYRFAHIDLNFSQFRIGSISVDIATIADVLLTCWILAFLVNRFALRQHQQHRTEEELRRARAVQHLLIPDQMPALPWCRVEAAYLPAREVSGDFFQVIRLSNTKLLVVLGDVAGKGMPAALTVSVLVGAVRALTEQAVSPAALLAALNQVLSVQKMSLTTCLALCIDPGGKLCLASAGHPAPYWNGKELEICGELPLGAAEGQAFQESVFQLQPGDHLLLLTDGVPEATGRDNAMFGWDRAQSLSTESANTVARAAERFGQNDDITVLSVSYVGD